MNEDLDKIEEKDESVEIKSEINIKYPELPYDYFDIPLEVHFHC
jgi:hypothetical protein